ncbi:MAG: ATP-binding protein [Acidobacteriota bacterium]
MLGVLDVAVSLEPTDRMIRSRGRGIKALGAAAVVSVSGLAALLLQVYVGQPVRRLVDATRLVADGQLDHVIEVDGQDEIARLAASFNRMTLSLQKTSREVSELNASLEARVLVKTTELHAAQLQVARAERLAAIGRMAAGIAHEINNPLTGVLTFSHLLLRAAPEGSRQRADLETIIRETNRCAGIIRDLLKFSRETPAKKGPCDVNTIARQALQLVQHQSELHNVRVVWQLAETVPRIVADASQIEQVFLNIIVNAVQAMPGGGDLTITSGLREGTSKGQGPAVYVTIADTGCGISPENVGKVFDPFFTTKDPGQGTGLGLSVSHELVESQGGSIEVDSVVGSGTQFTVVLPVDGASPPLGVAQ